MDFKVYKFVISFISSSALFAANKLCGNCFFKSKKSQFLRYLNQK